MAMVPHARAEDRLIVSQPTDYWFTFTEETVFVATTYQSGDLPSDPQLWLYAGDLLLFTNDDYIGLQSHIEMTLQPGDYRLRASTCCYEPDVWRDGIQWNIQYELYYTGIQVEPPTTTTTTTTTIPETTTTIQETTTTTWLPTTTSTEPTTTSTTTAPTTSVPVEEPPTTVQTTTTSSSTIPTTTIPGNTTSLVTVPPTTLPPTTVQTTTTSSSTTTTTPIGSTTVLATVPPTTTLPPTTTTSTTTTSLAPTTTVTTSTPPTEPPTTTTLPPNDSPPPPDASPAELVAYLDTVTAEDLATLDTEEITQLVDDIATAELTDEQAEQIALALTDAPAEVKEAFQEAVNVFGGQFDSYVPTGSTVPVGTRRTLIAVTTATFAASTPISRKKP